MEAIRKSQPTCKYFHISSAAVYGNPVHIPIKENVGLLPISPYGWHKLQAENICREFFELHQMPVVIVRPFSVYGPRLKKQLFWDWHMKAAGSEEVELWGTGNESRDFIYIDNLCRCFEGIISGADFRFSTYNVASGKETTIAEAAAVYFASYGKKYWFNNKKKEGTPVNWRADISSIQQLGFEARIALQEGINKLVEWQKNS